MDPMILVGLVVAAVAFTVSASAGMGGSLVMVPGMAMLFGTKEGVAIAAVLLGINNIAKVWAYRSTVPWRASLGVALATMAGALLGAGLLLSAPTWTVQAAVLAVLALVLAGDLLRWREPVAASPVFLAFGAGTTSGFSGSSGPLKGAALRRLGLDRMHLVGAASVVSLIGDCTKAAVYVKGALIPSGLWVFVALAVPLMPLATLLGRRINRGLGERAYAGLFWSVMAGYSLRLILA